MNTNITFFQACLIVRTTVVLPLLQMSARPNYKLRNCDVILKMPLAEMFNNRD
jgi:hypothetical protein